MAEDKETLYDGSKHNETHPTDENQETSQQSQGNPPVAHTSNDEPVWLNISKDEEVIYLSVEKDGDSVAIFPDNDLLRFALRMMHKFQN